MKEAIFKSIHDAFMIIGGGKSFGYYLAGFFFAGLAILISLYQSSRKRDVNSPNTPVQFSWRFLLWDNFKRAVTTLIVMFILFRVFDLGTPTLMIAVGFCVSLAFDQIIAAMMKWSDAICNLLSSDRSKFQKP